MEINKVLTNPKYKRIKEIYLSTNSNEIKELIERLYNCSFRFNLLENQTEYLLSEAIKPFLNLIETNSLEAIAKRESSRNLNDILFDQLEKLNKENDSTSLQQEINKSYASAQLAQQIVANRNTTIKAVKLINDCDLKDAIQLEMLGIKNGNI